MKLRFAPWGEIMIMKRCVTSQKKTFNAFSTVDLINS